MRVVTILMLMITALVAVGKGKSNHHTVHVLSSRMNIVHIKLDREMSEASIEIYNEQGELLKSEALHDRKVLIDFVGVQEGIYKIKIKHGSNEEVLNYINAGSFASVPGEEAEEIEIIQGI